jgi:predicted site-specific integrase-resolvase
MVIKMVKNSELYNLILYDEIRYHRSPYLINGNVNMLIGYARVSTSEQDLRSQEDVLKNAGCDDIYTDVVRGVKTACPGLHSAVSHLRKGDH